MAFRRNRWMVLLVLMLNNICLGAPYVWSIFNQPLMEARGWQLSQISLAYSLMLLVTFFANLLAGWLQEWVPPQWLLLAGGVLWGGGWALTGFAQTLPQLYLSFSLVTGLGSGLGYNTVVSQVPRWFPDRMGLANGVVVGGSGLAPLLFAPMGYTLLDRFGVENAFKVLGLVFLLVMGATFWVIAAPARGTAAAAAGEPGDKGPGEMLRDPRFYLLWFVLMTGATAGMIMTGHAAGIGRSLAGLDAGAAALTVSALAAANFSGRLVVGALSDRLGRMRTITVILCVILADMLVFPYAVTPPAFVAALMVVGFCFGAVMATFPALCADLFGRRRLSANWSVLYSGYTAASFLGPMAAARCMERFGSYQAVFSLSAGLLALGLVAAALAGRWGKRRKP